MKNNKLLTMLISVFFLFNIVISSQIAYGESSGSTNSGGGGSADMAIQAAIGLLGGIPIGQSVKYTFASGGLQSYVVCKTDNQRPEAYSKAQYACACFTVGGTCFPPVQTKSVEFTDGGPQSANMDFVSVRCTPHEACRFGYAKSNITSQVYNGSNGLDGANFTGGVNMSNTFSGVSTNPTGGLDGGVIISDDGSGNIIGGTDPSLMSNQNSKTVQINTGDYTSPNTNNPTGTGGGLTPNGSGNGDPSNGGSYENSSGENSDDPFSDGENIKSNSGANDYGDAIGELLNESGNGSFNAADDDWSTSDGGEEGTDNLDDYLNGSMDGTLTDDELIETTDDLLGLEAGLNSGLGGNDGNSFEDVDPATLLDTDGDGNVDSIDLDGDGLPDAKLLDTDGDGVFDAIDIDGDGNPDGWLIDEDGDGIPDGIDYNRDGVIDQYLAGHGPFVGEDGEWLNGEGEFDPMEAQLLDMIRQQMAGNGNPLAPYGMGAGGESSALDNSVVFNDLFGVEDGRIRRHTVSDQELFDLAKDLLKKLGLSEKDMLRGKQYDKNSAWTEPGKAWDFNRITTLIAKNKIKTTSSAQRDERKPATMSGAMNRK